MTSVVDQVTQPHDEPDASDLPLHGPAAPFSEEFVAEIRGILAPRTRGIFGPIAQQSTQTDDVAEPGPIRLILPRAEPVEARPELTGITLQASEPVESATPNLVVPPSATAEVTFVPAAEIQPERYRWVLVAVGLLAVIGAVWLTWVAQSGDDVDAPASTTSAPVSSTSALPSTTSAPASTTASTVAPTTATTATTIASTAAPTTAAPATPAPTTPRRPVTTARRPATTAAPTTAAPTTAATIPELEGTVVPTWAPAVTPPAESTAVETTPAPADTAPATPASQASDPPAEG